MKIDKAKLLQTFNESNEDTVKKYARIIKNSLKKAQTIAFNGVCQYVGNWEEGKKYYKKLSIKKDQVEQCEKIFKDEIEKKLAKKLNGELSRERSRAYYLDENSTAEDNIRYVIFINCKPINDNKITFFFASSMNSGTDLFFVIINNDSGTITIDNDSFADVLKILNLL